MLHARSVVLRCGLSLVSRSGDSAPGPKETEDAERARETDFQLPDRKAETAKQRQKIDQQECALGGLPPTNMPIAKTRYLQFWRPERIMQECAPGDKGGAAIGFAKMRFAIFLIEHCKRNI